MERDKNYILHILDEITAVETFIVDMSYEDFIVDEKTKRAVERSLEIIGEAAKNLSSEQKAKAPTIPWEQIAGLRDNISHHYFDVDYDTVWDVIIEDIPILKKALEKMNI